MTLPIIFHGEGCWLGVAQNYYSLGNVVGGRGTGEGERVDGWRKIERELGTHYYEFRVLVRIG